MCPCVFPPVLCRVFKMYLKHIPILSFRASPLALLAHSKVSSSHICPPRHICLLQQTNQGQVEIYYLQHALPHLEDIGEEALVFDVTSSTCQHNFELSKCSLLPTSMWEQIKIVALSIRKYWLSVSTVPLAFNRV